MYLIHARCSHCGNAYTERSDQHRVGCPTCVRRNPPYRCLVVLDTVKTMANNESTLQCQGTVRVNGGRLRCDKCNREAAPE